MSPGVYVFFSMCIGGFMFGHLFFIIILSEYLTGYTLVMPGSFSPAIFIEVIKKVPLFGGLMPLVISRGLSFVTNFIGKSEYKNVDLRLLFFAPYKRIVVMQITIIVGAYLVTQGGGNAEVIAILVLLKTVVDLIAHQHEHSQNQTQLLKRKAIY